MTAESLFGKVKIWHIVIACAIVYLCSLSAGLSLNGDDSNYILIGKSFLEKGLFHEVFISNELAKSSYYYFMFPLMLMPFIKLAPTNYLMMKLIPLVSAIGAVVLFNILLKGKVSDKARKVLLLLFGLNPWTVEYSGMILTDMPYIFFMLICLVLFEKYEEKKKPYLLILSVLLAGASLYTRPFGAALCLSFVAFSAVKKRWKDCVIIMAALIVIGIPIFVHADDISSTFFKSFVAKQDYYAYESKEASPKAIIYRAGRNLLVYTGNYLPDLLARPAVSCIEPRLPDKSVNPLFALKFLLGISMAVLITVGFLKTARESLHPYHLYIVFHLMICLVNGVYVARYILPLLPFMLLFLVKGIAAVGEGSFIKRSGSGEALIAILIVLALLGTGQEIAYARTGYLPAESKSFIECNDWIKSNTPAGALILSRKPSYTKLYTEHDAVGYIFIDDPDTQLKYISDKGVRLVIIGDLGFYLHEAEFVAKTVKKYPGSFRLLYTTRSKPENYIYEVIRTER